MELQRTDEERLSILKSSLKDSDYELWVAEADGEIVGFIDLWIIHDFCHGGKLSYVQNLHISQKIEDWALEENFYKNYRKSKRKEAFEIHGVTVLTTSQLFGYIENAG